MTTALAGCAATAVVGGAASLTAQAVKTTGKAAGTAARATIGGAKAADRLATRLLRRDDGPDADTADTADTPR